MNEKIHLAAKSLVAHGLQFAFGITGSGPSLALITELERLGACYFTVSHEASAAIMAGAVSRITGRTSASISIRGPGLANMIPGIVHNHFENNPALSISEAFDAEAPSYRKHKRLNQAALLSPTVKGIITLNKIGHLPDLFDTARKEIPGPVHLDLCAREAEQGSAMLSNSHKTTPQGKDVRRDIFALLNKAERPILVVGSLGLRRKWKEKLTGLKIPVLTTVAAKGALDESLAQSAGVFTGDGKELAPEVNLCAEADLVIGLGLRNTEVLSAKPLGKPTIIIDEANPDLADGFRADLLLAQANPDFFSDVLDALGRRCWGLERIASLRCTMKKALLNSLWLPPVCFDALNQIAFPYTLVLDAGSFCTIGEHFWDARYDRSFIGTSNSRAIGAAIPSAVASAFCQPGVPVFCVIGDGGMRSYPAEIKLAVEERLPIAFIFMTDGRYGSVASVPQPRPMSHRAITVFQPSWWRAVEGMGCEALPANSEKSFVAALETWNRKEPRFIEAAFDPEPYAAMTNRLR